MFQRRYEDVAVTLNYARCIYLVPERTLPRALRDTTD